MTKREWQRCFEPAPDDFRASVMRALDKKEDMKVKRIIPKTLVLAFALVFALAGFALAAGLGVLDFLKVDDVGALRVAQPTAKVTGVTLVDCEVREAVSDGLSAHIVAAYTAKNADDALLMEFDQEKLNKNELAFSADMKKAARRLIIGYNEMLLDGTEMSLQAGYGWRYESARTLVIDYVVDLRDEARTQLDEDGNLTVLPLDIKDQLALCLQPHILNENWETLETGDVRLTLDVPEANAERWRAEGTSEQDGYRIESATLARTDMACYLTLTLRDITPETDSAMQGSLWFRALDEKGEAYALLNGGYKLSLDDMGAEETVVVFLQRFEPDGMLRLEPYDSGTWQAFPRIDLTLVKE